MTPSVGENGLKFSMKVGRGPKELTLISAFSPPAPVSALAPPFSKLHPAAAPAAATATEPARKVRRRGELVDRVCTSDSCEGICGVGFTRCQRRRRAALRVPPRADV